MERGTRLTEVDWRGIRRHPDIGADLLRDIGVFGPVARDRALPSRARRRPRLPARADRRGDPRGREDRRRRRGLRHAHRAGHLPHADELVRGADASCGVSPAPARRGSTSSRSPSLLAGRGPSTATPTRRASTVELAMERRISEAAAPDLILSRSAQPARLQRRDELVELLHREPALAARGAEPSRWPAFDQRRTVATETPRWRAACETVRPSARVRCSFTAPVTARSRRRVIGRAALRRFTNTIPPMRRALARCRSRRARTRRLHDRGDAAVDGLLQGTSSCAPRSRRRPARCGSTDGTRLSRCVELRPTTTSSRASASC